VRFGASATAAQRSAALGAVGAVAVASVPELHIAIVEIGRSSADEQAAALAADPAVRSVERNYSRDAEAASVDPRVEDQWSLPRIGWDALHSQGLPSAPVTVAILDTGVDARHPDLAGRLLPGRSFVDGSPASTDPNGHGTWLAGIVAAVPDNWVGIAGIGGDGVRILPITVLGADGSGQDGAVIAGIVAAVDGGADVILMAFSSPGYSDALQVAVTYAWDHDVVLVAANGNDGTADPSYPAGDRTVMGIASTDRADGLVSDSNHGPQTFMAAPGVDILTTSAGADDDPATDDELRSISGTSAAAAEVAGAAAVLRALDPRASNAVIIGRLARSAAPAGTRAETGNGRLDLARAAADTGTDPVVPAGTADSAGGGPFVGPYVAASTATDCFRSVASGNWNATGTWQSAPAAGGCTVWSAATLTPTSGGGTITVRTGNTVTVTAAVTVDDVTVDAGGQVTVNATITLTLANGAAATDLAVNGILAINGTVSAPAGSVTVVGGTLTINNGGALNGTTTASLTINLGGSATNAGTFNFGTTLTVNGSLSSSTSVTLAATSILQVGGTLTMTGGTLTTQRASAGSVGSINSGGSIVLTGTAIWSIGTVATATATVASGGTLDIGPTAVVSGAGLLTVAAAGSLKIGSTAGIDATTTTGSVRTTATDSYATAANYEYKGTAAQITGAALPATVNNLTVNNAGAATVTLTNAATTVSGTLALNSGDLSTGAGANVLTLAAASTCSGTTDVISGSAATGGVSRTTLSVGTTYCFGNPQNQVAINSGSGPTALKVKLVKAAPAAKANAIARTYSISPTGGGVFASTVRLHYLDAELNGNQEGQLHQWRLSGSWSDQDPNGGSTTRDTVANWVQQSGIASFSLPDWTLAKNDPPVVTATVASLAYIENAVGVALDPGITVTDADSTSLASATVTLTTNYVNGQDSLSITSQNGITGNWTPATGVLALSGIASVANYQTALRSITYANVSDNPSILARTATFLANDGTSNGSLASRQITVTAVNDAPVLTATLANLAYTENAIMAVDPGIVATDADSASLTSAIVTLTGNYQAAQDVLAFSNQNGISGTWTPATGVMALAGVASPASYQAALRSITYTNMSDSPSTLSRTVTFVASDGTASSSAASRQMTVTAVNDAPVAAADAYSMVQGNSLVIDAPGVLANDTDVDSVALTVGTPRPVSAPASGTLTLNGDGSFTYTPPVAFTGVVGFTYVANDGAADSPPATVTITVGDGAYVSSGNWSGSYDANRYLALTFPAYVPSGSVVTGATFRHAYRSESAGETTCYLIEVYAGVTLLATHGSSGAPVSCNAGPGFVTDTVALPEVDTVAEADTLTIRLYVWNSAGHRSVHQLATLGVDYSRG
jgi:subtilisin family serine protease